MGVASFTIIWMKAKVTYTTEGSVLKIRDIASSYIIGIPNKTPRGCWDGKVEGLWTPVHIGTPY